MNIYTGTDATSALVPATNGFSGLNAGPVGSLASLGTPLITPAAINPSSIPISTSLLSLGAIAPQQAPSAWGMGAPFAGPLPGGTASTLACALSRQQKETRDLVLKRTGKVGVIHLSTSFCSFFFLLFTFFCRRPVAVKQPAMFSGWCCISP